jgi:hypothetical protein
VLDTYTGADINALCDLAKRLERLAQGIAYGSITVPE